MIQIPEAIKTLLKSDSTQKNFRVHFPNGERADITNKNIVTESVSFNESLCSENTLVFGTIEGSSIEFETVGVENIKGYKIECYLEVHCSSSVPGSVYKSDIRHYVYQIPYGVFYIDSCKKQADMTHRQVIAYTQDINIGLQSVDVGYMSYLQSPWYVKNSTCNINMATLLALIFPNAENATQALTPVNIVEDIRCIERDSSNPTHFNTVPIFIDDEWNNTLDITGVALGYKIPINTTDPVDELLEQVYTINVQGDMSAYMTALKAFIQTLKDTGLYDLAPTIFDYENTEYLYPEILYKPTESFLAKTATRTYVTGMVSRDAVRYTHKKKPIESGGVYSAFDYAQKVESGTTGYYNGNAIINSDLGFFQSRAQTFMGCIIPTYIQKDIKSIPRWTSGSPISHVEREVVSGTEILDYSSEIAKHVLYLIKPLYDGTSDSAGEIFTYSHETSENAFVEYVQATQLNLITVANTPIFIGNRDAHIVGTSTALATPPVDVLYRCVAVWNDEIHIFNGTQHYRLLHGSDVWELITNSLPFSVVSGDSVVALGQYLYVFLHSGSYAYTNDGVTWRVEPLGSIASGAVAVAYYGQIHLLNGTRHYKGSPFSGWTAAEDIPFNLAGTALVYNYQLWAISGTGDDYAKYRIYDAGRGWLLDHTVIFDGGQYITGVSYGVQQNPERNVLIPLRRDVKVRPKRQKIVFNSSGTVTSYTDVTGSNSRYEYAINPNAITSLDMRSLIAAYLEIQGSFGRIDRYGNIAILAINGHFDTPNAGSLTPSDYSTLWYDDYLSKPVGRITVTYKNSAGEDVYTYRDIVDNFLPSEHRVYDLTENYIVRNTLYTEEEIQTLLEEMGSNINLISYMPMEITIKGRPDVEVGDVFTVDVGDGTTFKGFVEQRLLDGIQGLEDRITSVDEQASELTVSLDGTFDEATGTLTLFTVKK